MFNQHAKHCHLSSTQSPISSNMCWSSEPVANAAVDVYAIYSFEIGGKASITINFMLLSEVKDASFSLRVTGEKLK